MAGRYKRRSPGIGVGPAAVSVVREQPAAVDNFKYPDVYR